MLEFFKQIISDNANNQMMIAGIVTLLTGSVLWLVKSIPLMILSAIYSRVSYEVVVYSTSSNFDKIVEIIENNRINWLSRSSSANGSRMSVGVGTAFSIIYGRLVKSERKIMESVSGSFKETLTITFYFSGYASIKRMMDEIAFADKDVINNKTTYYKLNDNWLMRCKTVAQRKRESVLIDEETLTYIESRIDFFLENRAVYERNGTPYKYSLMLHGEPGTGKTSLAKYIAAYTKRPVIISDVRKLENLSSTLSDSEVQNPVILVEDIDRDSVTNTDDVTDDKFNMATVLNTIDGAMSPENVIFIFTTNHIDRIDPAIIRKGRMDDVIEIKRVGKSEIARALRNNFGFDAVDLKKINDGTLTGAVVQDIIFNNYRYGVEQTINELNKKMLIA